MVVQEADTYICLSLYIHIYTYVYRAIWFLPCKNQIAIVRVCVLLILISAGLLSSAVDSSRRNLFPCVCWSFVLPVFWCMGTGRGSAILTRSWWELFTLVSRSIGSRIKWCNTALPRACGNSTWICSTKRLKSRATSLRSWCYWGVADPVDFWHSPTQQFVETVLWEDGPVDKLLWVLDRTRGLSLAWSLLGIPRSLLWTYKCNICMLLYKYKLTM